MHDNNICPHCKQGPDSQKYALSCTAIAPHLGQIEKEAMQNIKYEDIYGDSQAQLIITQVYQSIISRWIFVGWYSPRRWDKNFLNS